MRQWVGAVVLITAAVLASSILYAARPSTQNLFFIQRSINDNIVQYAVHCTPDGGLQSPNPVHAYWILGNGDRAELNRVQKRLAYGISSQRELSDDHYEFELAALKDRMISVRPTDDGYRALVLINGEKSVLERVYVECTENFLGIPNVLYIDLFGHAYDPNRVVKERIQPQ